MRCIKHPNNEAVLKCHNCDAAYCEECIITIKGKKYCRVCYNRNLIKHYKKKVEDNKIACSNCSEKIEKHSNYCMYCGNYLGSIDLESNKIQVNKKTKNTNGINFRISIKQILKHSLIIGLIFFVVSILILRKLSILINYSNTAMIFFTILAFLTTIYLTYLTIKNYRNHKKTLTKILSFFVSLFLFFSIACLIEINRINTINKSYKIGLLKIEEEKWNDAKYIFHKIDKATYNYQNANTYLDSANNMINKIITDSLIQVAWQNINLKKYEDALKTAKQLNKYSPLNNDIKQIYINSCEKLSQISEREYWNKNYVESKKTAGVIIAYLSNLSSQNMFEKDKYIEKANNIIKNSDNKIAQIQEEVKRQKIARENARKRLWEEMPNKITNYFSRKVISIQQLTRTTCWAQLSYNISNYEAFQLAENIGFYIKNTTGETPSVHVFKGR